MPVQIESHRLHLQVRHVQLLRAKFLAGRGEKKRKKNGPMLYAQMSYKQTMETPGEKGKFMLIGGTLPAFPYPSVKLKFARKHFMVSRKKKAGVK